MPSLFRRKSEDLVAETASSPASTDVATRTRGFTPSKRDQGKATPKRRETTRRTIEAPPANRREAVKRMRERQKVERIEARQGLANGEEKYLPPRDKGPERALVRDIVDSRHTIGTWFFGCTFLVMLVGFNRNLNPSIYLAANALFVLFALATLVDSILISRTVKRMMAERFPTYPSKLRGLYFYAIMRAISFRFIRNPKPRVKTGTTI